MQISPDNAEVPVPTAEARLTRTIRLGSGPLRAAIKECLAVEGLPTRCGSAAFENAPTEPAHATVVQRLIDSGDFTITHLAGMHELAFGMTGENRAYGTPLNPNWPDRITGGSSSGAAAAVAAGDVDVAIGTDTGGSVRLPAACCGVWGFKPTFDRLSRRGAIPRQSSLDCVGPIASDIQTIIRAMRAMDPTFEPAELSREPRLGRVKTSADGFIETAIDEALCESAVVQRSLPGLDAAFDAGMTIINAELAEAFGDLARSDASLGDDVRQRLLRAMATTREAVERAELVRQTFSAEIDAALEGIDVLVLPTLPTAPPTWAEARNPVNILPLSKYVRPFNLSGHPAISIPLKSANGLPASLQLVGVRERTNCCARWLCSLPAVHSRCPCEIESRKAYGGFEAVRKIGLTVPFL